MWATEGRNADSLQAFFAGLTDEQKASIKAVSIDMSAGYEKAIRAEDGVPHAQVVFDPFHVVQLGGKAAELYHVRSVARPPTRSAATSTTSTDDPRLAKASGSRAPATRC